MSGARRHLDPEADPAEAGRAHRADRGHPDPAVASRNDPRLAHAGGAADLLHLQRMAGNSAVASLVAPTVQRVEIDEITSEIGGGGAPATPSPDAAPGPGDAGGDSGQRTISGSVINLDAPVTHSSGIIEADTLVANNVVAANYTPGAGNAW